MARDCLNLQYREERLYTEHLGTQSMCPGKRGVLISMVVHE